MVRDAEATRRRILAAARSEFAAGGLAGARVDRIAAAAGANKQLLYAYFGSKEGLFDAVMRQVVAGLLGDVPFDPEDLPGYAVALFDYGVSHPDLIRLARWHNLERPGVLARLPEGAEATRSKLQGLADLQRRGVVDATLSAPYLLEQVLALVHSGNDGVFAEFAVPAPEAADSGVADSGVADSGVADSGATDSGVADSRVDVAGRRAALRHTVQRLIAPTPPR